MVLYLDCQEIAEIGWISVGYAGLISLPILLERNSSAHMTPVISDSWFVKGELLFHILEHDGFISTSTKRKYTEGSVFRTKCPPLSLKENSSQIFGLGMYMCMCNTMCVFARNCVVICMRLANRIVQFHFGTVNNVKWRNARNVAFTYKLLSCHSAASS